MDPNTAKVELINSGRAPVVEAELAELTRRAVSEKRLRATTDPLSAVLETDVTFVCVPTPSQTNGNLDFRYLERVCAEIGAALREKRDFHVVVVRSTILPGTLKGLAIPTLEQASGRKVGEDFGVCHNPEFLRESTAVADFRNPPKTVIGASDSRAGDIVQRLYEGFPGPLIRCAIEVGEMVKYADNSWHATKITFANEIGKICKSLGLDSHAVMDIFCKDAKLNLSPYYLKPGFAFGGSCLPKDLRAITYHARSHDVSTPLLNSLMFSNSEQVEQGIAMVLAARHKKVGVLGFSFKAGTDDLRESPLVEVIERLIGKGFDLQLYDRNVNLAKLTGANRDYILNHIPHIACLMRESMQEVMAHADVVVIGNSAPEFTQVPGLLREGQKVIDLVRIKADFRGSAQYAGICW